MDLPTITNAPRELVLGGAVYRARAITLADLGEVLAWLDDHVPADRDDPTPGPLRLSAEASRLALATTEGLAVVLHLALLPCHPALTRAQARTLASALTREEAARLMAIAFRRRPAYARGDRGAAGRDVADIRWGEVVEVLARHRGWVYPEVLRLTLDQYDNHVARGELPGPDDLDLAEVQRMWDAAMVEPEGNGIARLPETLA